MLMIYKPVQLQFAIANTRGHHLIDSQLMFASLRNASRAFAPVNSRHLQASLPASKYSQVQHRSRPSVRAMASDEAAAAKKAAESGCAVA